MSRLGVFAFCVAVAASPRIVDANSCNLYLPQRWGEIRVGCSLTVFALPEINASLPNITRAGQLVSPTIVHDQVTLEVTMEHYPSPDSCDLVRSSDNRTFDRYVMTWGELQPGDEIEVDGHPMTVPGIGDCGVVDPFFYCQDPIHFCDDDMPPPEMNEVDQGGCSAGSGSPSWLAICAVVALGGYSRWPRARTRRHLIA